MLFHRLKIALVLGSCLFLVTPLLHAEDHGAATPAEEGAPPPITSKDQREFSEKSQRLQTLAARIEESDKQFKELVQTKAHEKNPQVLEGILKQMNVVVKERNKSAEEFNRLKSEIAQRYPSQGLPTKRRYETQAKKSVEELEGAAGLDELLTRTKKIIEKKFATFEDPELNKTSPIKPTTTTEEKPERLRLEK